MARAHPGLEGSSPRTTARGDLRIGGGPEAGEQRSRKVRRAVACQSTHAHRPSDRGCRPGPTTRRLRRFTAARPAVVCNRWVGDPHHTAFVIPAADVPGITTASIDRGDPGYQGSFRLEPLAEKMRPFAVPTEKLGATILERLFGGRPR